MLPTPDDRGQPVRPFRPGLLFLLRIGSGSGTLPPHLCVRALRRCGWPHAAFLFAVTLSVLVGLAAVWLGSSAGWNAGRVILVLVPFTAVANFLVTGVFVPRGEWRKWVDEIVAHDHCPSCGHPLHGLPIADDGCRVCPECGSAWAPRSLR